jgi:hypothetical protein
MLMRNVQGGKIKPKKNIHPSIHGVKMPLRMANGVTKKMERIAVMPYPIAKQTKSRKRK